MIPTFAAANLPAMTPTRWYAALAALSLALVVGTVWIARVLSDIRSKEGPEGDSPTDLLGPLAKAFSSGQMTREEYARIQRSVGLGAGEPVRRGPQPGPKDEPSPGPIPGAPEDPGVT